VLEVGAVAVLDIQVHVSGRNEKVEVQDAEPAVELATSAISGVVDSHTVRELPLNARDWTQLAILDPGVSTTRTQVALNAGKAQRGFGTQMTIDGGRPQQNNYRLDGISINDYSNGAPGSVVGVDLGVDAVQEFSVLTSNYPADYGRSSGGVVNAVTKSGTNAFHGDVYEFLRNSALDARNYFDYGDNGAPTKPPFKRNQFGGSVGGPVIKDRTFFFADYEGLRQSLGVTRVDTVPSAASRDGSLFPVDPSVLRFVNAFYPLPNQPSSDPSVGIYTFSGQQATSEDYFTTRLDHHFSSADSLVGTYVFDTANITQPDELNNKFTGFDSRRQILTLEETHIFRPNLINAARFGISRVVANGGNTSLAGNPAAGDASYGVVPGKAAPDVAVPGISEFTGGLASISTYHFHWTSIQAYDDAFLTLGQHSIKFGISFERIRSNETAFTDPTGVFSYNSLSDFMGNATPAAFTATIPNTIQPREFRQSLVGPYVQDDWRLRKNLTLNLGLRYEFATVMSENQGRLASLTSLTAIQPHLGNPMMGNPTTKNFEPRIGFAWDPTGSGHTAVRAGFGMFDVLPLPYEFELLQAYGAPWIQIGVATQNLTAGAFAPPATPASAYNKIFPTSDQVLRQTYLDPHPKRNYVMQWNLNVQREMSDGLTVMVGYVGSRGIHQPYRVEDADIVLPTNTPAGYLWPNPIGSGTRLNPNWGQIAGIFWVGQSSYNALQSKVQKRLSHGLEIGGAYTWAKSLDSSSTSLVGDAFSNSVSSLPWFDIRRSWGPSDFNIAHNVVINASWELPGKKGSGFTHWATSGYELGTIFQASTGTPFTVGFGGDALGLNSTDPTLDVPSVLQTPNCHSLVNPGNINYVKTECFTIPMATPAIAANCVAAPGVPGSCLNLLGNLRRNSLVGPALMNLDFSLFKNNRFPRISENFNVQFRMEVFNILNRTNFAPPTDNLALFDGSGSSLAPGNGGTAGQLTTTATSSRQIQVAVKVIW
jgi:hypothetical protein